MSLPKPRTSPEERELRARVPLRDRAAFEWLEANYGRPLYRQACAILPSGLDAGDVVQDVWVAALTYAHRYDPARSPWPWLSRICLHVCVQAKARRRVPVDDDATRSAPGPDGPRGTSPNGARDALHRALRRLSRRLREVVALRFLFSVDAREIAVLLRMSPNTVSQALVRGLERLRVCEEAPVLAGWMAALDEDRGRGATA